MSDDDVMQALNVLKRHHRLENSMFFFSATVKASNKEVVEFYLPAINTCVRYTGRGLVVHGPNGTMDLNFASEKDRDGFLHKWRLARLAAMV